MTRNDPVDRNALVLAPGRAARPASPTRSSSSRPRHDGVAVRLAKLHRPSGSQVVPAAAVQLRRPTPSPFRRAGGVATGRRSRTLLAASAVVLAGLAPGGPVAAADHDLWSEVIRTGQNRGTTEAASTNTAARPEIAWRWGISQIVLCPELPIWWLPCPPTDGNDDADEPSDWFETRAPFLFRVEPVPVDPPEPVPAGAVSPTPATPAGARPPSILSTPPFMPPAPSPSGRLPAPVTSDDPVTAPTATQTRPEIPAAPDSPPSPPFGANPARPAVDAVGPAPLDPPTIPSATVVSPRSDPAPLRPGVPSTIEVPDPPSLPIGPPPPPTTQPDPVAAPVTPMPSFPVYGGSAEQALTTSVQRSDADPGGNRDSVTAAVGAGLPDSPLEASTKVVDSVRSETGPDGSVSVSLSSARTDQTKVNADRGRDQKYGGHFADSATTRETTSFSISAETAAAMNDGEPRPDWSDPLALRPGDSITAEGYRTTGSTTGQGVGINVNRKVVEAGLTVDGLAETTDVTSVARIDDERVEVYTGTDTTATERARVGVSLEVGGVGGGYTDSGSTSVTYSEGIAVPYHVGTPASSDQGELNDYASHLDSGEPALDPHDTYEAVVGASERHGNSHQISIEVDVNGVSGTHRSDHPYHVDGSSIEHRTAYNSDPNGPDSPMQSATSSTDTRSGSWWAGAESVVPFTDTGSPVTIQVDDWVDAGGGYGQTAAITTENGTLSADREALRAAATAAVEADPAAADNPVIAGLIEFNSARTALDPQTPSIDPSDPDAARSPYEDPSSSDVIDAVALLDPHLGQPEVSPAAPTQPTAPAVEDRPEITPSADPTVADSARQTPAAPAAAAVADSTPALGNLGSDSDSGSGDGPAAVSFSLPEREGSAIVSFSTDPDDYSLGEPVSDDDDDDDRDASDSGRDDRDDRDDSASESRSSAGDTSPASGSTSPSSVSNPSATTSTPSSSTPSAALSSSTTSSGSAASPGATSSGGLSFGDDFESTSSSSYTSGTDLSFGDDIGSTSTSGGYGDYDSGDYDLGSYGP